MSGWSSGIQLVARCCNLDSRFGKSDMRLSVQIPIRGPVVLGSDPRPDDEEDTSPRDFIDFDRRFRFVENSGMRTTNRVEERLCCVGACATRPEFEAIHMVDVREVEANGLIECFFIAADPRFDPDLRLTRCIGEIASQLRILVCDLVDEGG